MKPQDCCVLIPSLSPDERLPAYVRELTEAGFGLVLVVDDGSAAEYQPIFDRIAEWEGCHVLHHEVNRGKGAALRTGYAYIKEKTQLQGVITADSDGQHTVPDALSLARELSGTAELLLGSRDFSRKSTQVPPKSRAGNRITSCVFRVLYGHWLPDTQTGLRAFSRGLIDFMLSIKGDRFEYEMNVLIYCAGKQVPMRALPIQTVYHDENKGSHFHPVRDSWRIYKLLLGNFFKFMSASCLATLVDLALFSLLRRWMASWGLSAVPLLGLLASPHVFLATAIARVCSATLNFKLNKSFVFNLKQCRGAVGRYLALCVGVMIVSGLSVGFISSSLSRVWPGAVNETLIKAVVDTLLFFVNYRVQKAWVFPQENTAAVETH